MQDTAIWTGSSVSKDIIGLLPILMVPRGNPLSGASQRR